MRVRMGSMKGKAENLKDMAELYIKSLNVGLAAAGMIPNEHYNAAVEAIRDFAEQANKYVRVVG
jgi:hypothetical protein